MPSTDEEDTTRNPLTQPAFLASSVVVALIVVLGLVLIFSGSDEGSEGANSPPKQTTTATTTDAKAASDSSCGLPAGDQEVPTEAPAGTRWELVGKMIAPTAPTAIGPGQGVGGVRTCFQRSPVGALYAAVNFWATLTARTEAETYRELAVESPERDRAIAAATEEKLAGLQVAGFAFSSYEPDRASVRLAFRMEDGRLVSADTPLTWNDGDWRYKIPLDQGAGSVAQLASLDAFIAWKGE